jgi:hypothetical protein
MGAIMEWGGPVDPQNFPTYACQRPTPLQHYNQAITPALEELRDYYYAAQDDNR